MIVSHHIERSPLLKLANWNVMLPVSPHRREALRSHIDQQQADVWVLTETHDGFTTGQPHCHSSAAGRDGKHKPEHRWVTIWSRFPIEPLETSDEERTAAVRIKWDAETPFIVYGTVLPWIGSKWREFASAEGVAFREALAVQAADWNQLRQEYPDDEFFVIGDFNQDLVTPHYYGSRINRDALEAALQEAGLVALTGGEEDPIRRDSAPCACIDHICAREDSRWQAEPAVRWPDVSVPDKKLTDHFGVSIAFTTRT